MDPNTNLEEQLDLANQIVAINNDCDADGELSDDQEAAVRTAADRLADLVIALDEWIRKGGFLPTAWNRGRGI